MHPLVVLAQAAPEGGAAANPVVVGGVSVSVVLVLVAIAWIGTMKWGWKWSAFICGMCVGTAGSAAFPGDISRMLIGILIKMISSLGSAFG